jgi:hypothetical protein
VGKKIPSANKAIYIKVAEDHVKLLQQYEKGSTDVEYVDQGQEPPTFWKLWGLKDDESPDKKWKENEEWNNWFLDLAKQNMVVAPPIHSAAAMKEEEEPERLGRKSHLYTYPNVHDFATMFDADELNPDGLVIVCSSKPEGDRVFVWRGFEYEPGEVSACNLNSHTMRFRWMKRSFSRESSKITGEKEPQRI